MRILHIDRGREMRGGQWQVLRLLHGLRARGCESILMARSGTPLATRAARDGFPVERIAARFPASDLVHTHDARSHTFAALFARVPIIAARRVAFPVKRGVLSRWKYRRPAHFMAVSRFVAETLRQAGVPDNRISIVPDGVPLLALSTREGSVIAPASDDPLKGNALAIDAARLSGTPIQFSRDLEADLKTARMMLYLTHSEGLGSGVLLAMSAGVPVIASRVGGLPEIIDDGVNGLLTENSAVSVAACLRDLHADSIRAARLATAARRTIEERFTVERMVEDTLAIYHKVLHV